MIDEGWWTVEFTWGERKTQELWFDGELFRAGPHGHILWVSTDCTLSRKGVPARTISAMLDESASTRD